MATSIGSLHCRLVPRMQGRVDRGDDIGFLKPHRRIIRVCRRRNRLRTISFDCGAVFRNMIEIPEMNHSWLAGIEDLEFQTRGSVIQYCMTQTGEGVIQNKTTD